MAQIQAQQDQDLLTSLFGIGAAVGGFLIGGPAGASAGSMLAGKVTQGGGGASPGSFPALYQGGSGALIG
jgi:hypothetical protein